MPAEASNYFFRKICADSARAGRLSVEKVVQEMGHWFKDTRVAASIDLMRSIILATSFSRAVWLSDCAFPL